MEVERVLGKPGGVSEIGGGLVMRRDGLEQFPIADLDKEPRWDKVHADGGVDGDNGDPDDGGEGDVTSGAARLNTIVVISHYRNLLYNLPNKIICASFSFSRIFNLRFSLEILGLLARETLRELCCRLF